MEGKLKYFKLTINMIVAHDVRFRGRHRCRPFPIADECLRNGVRDSVWDRNVRQLEATVSCCLERGVCWPVVVDMSKVRTIAEKRAKLKRAIDSFGSMDSTSLEQEHWHTFQRICAAGDKSRPTTFARQSAEYCHEFVIRRYERATGFDLSKPPPEAVQLLRDATTERQIHRRPNQLGNKLLLLMNEMRAENVNVTMNEVEARWESFSEAEQQRRLDQMKIIKAGKEVKPAPRVPAKRDPPAHRPWSVGANFPTTPEMLQSFLGHFKRKFQGTFEFISKFNVHSTCMRSNLHVNRYNFCTCTEVRVWVFSGQ